MTAIEQPSMLPRAVELLAQEDIGEAALLAQGRVPASLFQTVTSRTPGTLSPEPGPATSSASSGTRVISLLERRQARALGSREDTGDRC